MSDTTLSPQRNINNVEDLQFVVRTMEPREQSRGPYNDGASSLRLMYDTAQTGFDFFTKLTLSIQEVL